MMNEIAKKATADKFLRALEKEGLSKSDAGACIGFAAPHVSYLFNEKYWERLGIEYWDKLLAWVNSGQSLVEYSEKHGKVLFPGKPAEKIKEAEQTKSEPFESEEKLSVNLAEIGWIIGMHKDGRSVDQIAKKLKIYPGIVKSITSIIASGVIPLEKVVEDLKKNTEIIKAPHYEKTIIDIEINLSLNGQRIKIN